MSASCCKWFNCFFGLLCHNFLQQQVWLRLSILKHINKGYTVSPSELWSWQCGERFEQNLPYSFMLGNSVYRQYNWIVYLINNIWWIQICHAGAEEVGGWTHDLSISKILLPALVVSAYCLCVSDHKTCCISTFIVDTVHLNMWILTEQCIIRHTGDS